MLQEAFWENDIVKLIEINFLYRIQVFLLHVSGIQGALLELHVTRGELISDLWLANNR